MKKVIFLLALCMGSCLLNAQITTNEQPLGLKLRTFDFDKKGIETVQAPDMSIIKKEDYENDNAAEPVRFAYAVKVDFNIQNSGTWYEMGDGSKIWRLKVILPGALSTNAIYDKFWLPKGGKFFVYSEETNQAIGAITSDYIEGRKANPTSFATELIYGESVIFEYYSSITSNELPEISISRIDYGYRYVENPYLIGPKNFGDSGNCNINVNCTTGADWQNEKHAIARVSIPASDGSYWCSCALINNTSYNYAPYALTADHCLKGLDAITNNSASSWIFYWEYEHSGCVNGSIPSSRTTVGATVKANHPDSDFALLLLTQNPLDRNDVLPYYLGWDSRGNSGTGGVGIHHPRGDVKKISTYTITPQSTNMTSNATNASGAYWRVVWMSGTTEGGSSGSPLINSDRRVIGQLQGGDASCNSLTSPDWFGKFSVSWTGKNSSDNRRKLHPWLAPNASSSPTLINGSYPFFISGSSPLVCTGSNATFTVNSPSSSYAYVWNKSANLTQVSASGNTATFRAGGKGSAWVSVSVNGTEVTRHIFHVGVPSDSDISGHCVLYEASSRTYRASASCPIAEKYEWKTLSSGWNISSAEPGSSQTMNDVLIIPTSYSTSSASLAVRAYNSCGWSEWKLVGTVSNNIPLYTITTTPNPASSTISIILNYNDSKIGSDSFNTEYQNNKTNNLDFSNEIKRPNSFIIRVYSILGSLALQTTSKSDNTNLQLDVSLLSDGVYYLQVLDDIGGEPQTSTIMVKH